MMSNYVPMFSVALAMASLPRILVVDVGCVVGVARMVGRWNSRSRRAWSSLSELDGNLCLLLTCHACKRRKWACTNAQQQYHSKVITYNKCTNNITAR